MTAAVRSRPAPGRGSAKLDLDRPVPAAGARPVRRARPVADRPGGLLQPVPLERPQAADRLRRAGELREGPVRPGLHRGGLAQRPDHRPVAGAPDPVRARAGVDAQPAVPRPVDPPPDLLRAVRDLRRSSPGSSSSSSSCPTGWSDRALEGVGLGDVRPGLAGGPLDRDAHDVRRSSRGSTSGST